MSPSTPLSPHISQSQNFHVTIFVMVLLTWWSNMSLCVSFVIYISWYSCRILMAASHLTTSFFDRFERARPVEISCGNRTSLSYSQLMAFLDFSLNFLLEYVGCFFLHDVEAMDLYGAQFWVVISYQLISSLSEFVFLHFQLLDPDILLE